MFSAPFTVRERKGDLQEAGRAVGLTPPSHTKTPPSPGERWPGAPDEAVLRFLTDEVAKSNTQTSCEVTALIPRSCKVKVEEKKKKPVCIKRALEVHSKSGKQITGK